MVANREAPNPGSSDVRESVSLLHVAVAQIDVTMHEGDASVAVLSGALSSIAAGLKSIEQCAQKSPSAGEPAQKGNVSASCSTLAKKVEAAIMAIQFYDAMTQKLTHISENLRVLADFIADPGRVRLPCEWHDLRQRTRARFTMESERRVFDALMRGMPMEEAVRAAKPEGAEPPPAGAIDLF
ncbi:MAG: hypothetical protein M3436_06275 [Pseudomonadota bacterium]|nr:hypothetical protein [Pseudomonadota bacterium]